MTTVPSIPPPLTVQAGTVLLDKYRVLDTLGIGGMGYVVACEHVGLGSKVAMKFLLPQFAVVPESAARFVREARAATKIASENVVRVLDAGTMPDGVPYMVMEHLDGSDLARQLRTGRRFSIEEAIDYVVQAASALAYAHSAGIVHRDVKPANLFLHRRHEGEIIKVLDFGISKVIEEAQDLTLTKTTSVLGSGLYMSPEQMRSARDVDARTDVYALGVCLYELLTGSYPYTAENFSELCLKVNLDPPEPIRKHRPDVSDALAVVIERSYAKKREERFQSVAAFARALAPFAGPVTRARLDAFDRFSTERIPLQSTPAVAAQTIDAGRRDTAPPAAPASPVKLVVAGIVLVAVAAGVTAATFRLGGPSSTPESPTQSSSPANPPPPSAQPPPTTAVTTAPPEAPSADPGAAPSAEPAASASTKRPRVPVPGGSVKLCDYKDPITGLKDPTKPRVPCK